MDLHLDGLLGEWGENSTVISLLRNPRNARVKNRNGAYYHCDEHGVYHILSGLLPSLRRTFWPEADTQKMARTVKRRGRTGAKRGRFYGSIRGTEVHRELQDFIEMDRRYFARRHPFVHEYTRRILQFVLQRQGWKPIATEFDVYDETLRIGTSIDLVCADRNGRVIFVELKTGYAGYFDAAGGRMQHSLAHLTDSAHHQAAIQLVAATAIVLRHHRLPLDRIALYVIRVDDTTLDYYRLNSTFIKQNARDIYDDLERARQS